MDMVSMLTRFLVPIGEGHPVLNVSPKKRQSMSIAFAIPLVTKYLLPFGGGRVGLFLPLLYASWHFIANFAARMETGRK